MGRNLDLYQFHTPSRKHLDFQSRGEAQKTQDFRCRRKFGVYRHAQSKFFLQFVNLLIIFGVTHTGNRMRHTQLFPQQAGKHIYLIRGGCRNQQICLRHTCSFLDKHACTVPLHTHNIHRIGSIIQNTCIIINYNDVMSFTGELSGDSAADLAIPYDYNLHAVSSLSFKEIF